MPFFSANTYNAALLGVLLASIPLDLVASGVVMGTIVFLDYMFSSERMFGIEGEQPDDGRD